MEHLLNIFPNLLISFPLSPVVKAVIPVAGLGTRMLPLTKSQPKEMLPVYDRPAIQYVVEEATDSGIKDILLITGKGKRAIEDYFSPNLELENFLRERGKEEDIAIIRNIAPEADIFYVRQKEPKGLGNAVMYAEKHVGTEPFVVLLGDDIILNDVPASRQLMEAYWKYDSPVIGVERVPKEDVSRYGIIAPGEALEEGIFRVEDLVEKPEPEDAPSDYAIIGRYLLTPEIFTYLREAKPDAKGEIQLTDALRRYNREHGMVAVELKGTRLDVGGMEGWLMANIKAATIRDPTLAERIKKGL